MYRVKLEDAQQRLPALLERAVAGNDVVIVRDDGVAVRLAPVREPRPIFGSGRGLVEMGDEFDAPIEGFEPYAP